MFALAADKSREWGYAANSNILEHYQRKLGAIYLGTTHQYYFAVLENEALKLLEVYDYEWNNTENT